MTDNAKPRPLMPGQLTVTGGPDLGAVFMVGPDEMLIGRGETASIHVGGEGVSREHVRLTRNRGGAVLLADLGSANGTLVNGRQADEVVLRSGDRIRVGRACEFVFVYDVADERDTVDLEDGEAARSVTNNLSTARRNQGRMLMDQDEWQAALRALTSARAELEQRASIPPLELAGVFSDLAECQLELGMTNVASETAGLAVDLAATREGGVGLHAAALFTVGRARSVSDAAAGREVVSEARRLLTVSGALAQRIDAWLADQTG